MLFSVFKKFSIINFFGRFSYDIFGQSWQIVRQLAFDKVEGKSEGLHVEINEEGGYAAAIVSLMAKDRLLFQTEVPQVWPPTKFFPSIFFKELDIKKRFLQF